jgi:hypothetical protein
MAETLERTIQRIHSSCPVQNDEGDHLIRDILAEAKRVLTPLEAFAGSGPVTADLSRWIPLLRKLALRRQVGRVNGDLHTRNVLLTEGQPVLLDALEYAERLTCRNVHSDLGFLSPFIVTVPWAGLTSIWLSLRLANSFRSSWPPMRSTIPTGGVPLQKSVHDFGTMADLRGEPRPGFEPVKIG